MFPAGDVIRLWAVWLATAASLFALLYPLAYSTEGLTTASLGSCDAGDYAAGARVLKEFAHTDRSGFLGLTEVVRVMSVDNYYDYWLRLNHFTPSALVALNGTIFGRAPHEIISILAAVLFAVSIPVTFWIARAVLRIDPVASISVAILYGFNPIAWYAVYHVAMGQLLAASAIAIVTWAGTVLWNAADFPRRALAFVPILAVAYTVILGSYTFIIALAGIPAFAYAAGLAVRRGLWQRFLRWLSWMLAPLILSASVFYCRVTGLIESAKLFRTYDFGWQVPKLWPDGWVGIVYDKQLFPCQGIAHLASVAVIVGVLVWGLVEGIRRRRRPAFAALAIILPIMAGYAYLGWHGSAKGGNASYDAYKLFAVFYPCLLPALCCWLTLGQGRVARWLTGVLALAVFAGVAYADFGERGFERAMSHPSLVVDRDLVDLGRIEAMPEVTSLNMRIPEMWNRIWASEFLLRKPQYFATHTYLGRLNTPLRGEWDLTGGLVSINLPRGESVRLNERYSLAKVASPHSLRIELGNGWYDLESAAGGSTIWRWSIGDAVLVVDNPQSQPLKMDLRLDASSLEPRELQLWINGKRFDTFQTFPERHIIGVSEISVTPGETQIELRSNLPYTAPGHEDLRRLGFALYGIEAEVR